MATPATAAASTGGAQAMVNCVERCWISPARRPPNPSEVASQNRVDSVVRRIAVGAMFAITTRAAARTTRFDVS